MKRLKITSAIVAAAILFVFAASAQAMEMGYDITPKAKLVKLNLQYKDLIKASSEKMIVFDITLRNTDSVANLYSITVMIPGVGAAEDFIPVAGEKNLAPNAEAKTSIGIASDKFPPKGFEIRIEAVESR